MKQAIAEADDDADDAAEDIAAALADSIAATDDVIEDAAEEIEDTATTLAEEISDQAQEVVEEHAEAAREPAEDSYPDPDSVAAKLARIPAAREGAPEEVARAIHWLLSGDASYATGSVLTLDGGFTLGISFAKQLAEARNVTDDWKKGMSLLNRWQSLYRLSYDGNPSHMASGWTAFVDSLPTTPSPL